MWRIQEHRRVERQLYGKVPIEILKRCEKWKDIVRLSGPAGLLAIKGFHDEAWTGQRQGHRSSRLNIPWRVVYRVEADVFFVEVVKVTAHDYRKS